MSFDPTDIQAVKDVEDLVSEVATELARREADDIRWLMSDKRGRRVLMRLLTVSGVFNNPYQGSSMTDFRCGAMSIGQMFQEEAMRLSLERYATMLTEKQENDQRIADRLRPTE